MVACTSPPKAANLINHRCAFGHAVSIAVAPELVANLALNADGAAMAGLHSARMSANEKHQHALA